jgi:transcriptional regulator GlxA family with amidase domain
LPAISTWSHLGNPLDAAEIAKVVGLHPNYALNLFTRVMHEPIHRFVMRMRLIKAREVDFTTSLPVETIAYDSGFRSVSHFYMQFRRADGLPLQRLRREYL